LLLAELSELRELNTCIRKMINLIKEVVIAFFTGIFRALLGRMEEPPKLQEPVVKLKKRKSSKKRKKSSAKVHNR
jgi:hypothetical protein